MNRNLLHTGILLLLVAVLLLTKPYWSGSSLEYGIAVAGILIAGIPHGAMDHLTASFLKGTKFRLFKYLIQYTLSALLYLAVWFLFPGVALLLFLLLTAWHFGETDLVCFTNKKKSPIIIFGYGFCLLMWLLLKDADTTLQWIQLVAGKQEYVDSIITALSSVPHLLWFVLSAVMIFITVINDQTKWLPAFMFLCFLFVSVYTSLILGFIIYFTGWHSLQALQHIRLSVFKHSGLVNLVLNALPATLGSVVLLFLIVTYGKEEWVQSSSLPSLFILLSVLTLPHMAEMHRLYTVKGSDFFK
ncbi:MAG: Brp/Blh family beta-carotene 15,15'-dioxygenase [Chitinophagaceae bacterium]|jgi:Brp/Blh family beta-carotene 15,15'-monooxygenase